MTSRNKRAAGFKPEAAKATESPVVTQSGAPARTGISRRVEWALFGVFCLLALWLHVVLYEHAGAFWRDETSTLQIADSPSLGALWARLSKDSAPVLMFGLLRLWAAAGPGATDAGLRAFGTLVSVGILASLLVSCRMLTGRVPLVATALIVFNPAVFYFGSSLRAYGIAILLIMPCSALLGRVARQPTRRRVAASQGGHHSSFDLCCGSHHGNGGAAVCADRARVRHRRRGIRDNNGHDFGRHDGRSRRANRAAPAGVRRSRPVP